MQRILNPAGKQVLRYGVRYRVGDKIMQTRNDYDKDAFNGDIGRIVSTDVIYKPDFQWLMIDSAIQPLSSLKSRQSFPAAVVGLSHGVRQVAAIDVLGDPDAAIPSVPIEFRHRVLVQQSLTPMG